MTKVVSRFGARAAAVLAAAGFFAGAAFGAVTLTPQTGAPANIGGVAEVAVAIDHTDAAPSTVILYLAFESARLAPAMEYFEIIPRDAGGGVLRDDAGNVVPRLSPVLPSEGLTAAGKIVDTQFISALASPSGWGCLGVAVAGTDTPIPKGAFVTVAFRVLEGNLTNDTVKVVGLDISGPAVLGNRAVFTSAAAADGADLETAVADGSVALGCAAPAVPAAPAAGSGRTDGVELTWTAAAGMEYRLFRSEGTDPAAARGLGSGWTGGGSFLDITAESPRKLDGAGCQCGAKYEPVVYNYWLCARDASTLCRSGLSQPPVEGARQRAGATKAFAVPLSVRTYPPRNSSGERVLAGAFDPAALRLEGVSGMAEEFLEVAVSGGGGDLPGLSSWVPDGPDAEAGWAVFTPSAPWTPGDRVVVRVSIRDASGGTLAPLAESFNVAGAVELLAASARKTVLAETGAVVPPPAGASAVYALRPDAFYPQSLAVELDVPAGMARPALWMLRQDGGEAFWIRAEFAGGWLDGPVAVGSGALGASVRHGAVICVAPEDAGPGALPAGAAEASMSGDLWVAVLAVAALTAARRRVRRV